MTYDIFLISLFYNNGNNYLMQKYSGLLVHFSSVVVVGPFAVCHNSRCWLDLRIKLSVVSSLSLNKSQWILRSQRNSLNSLNVVLWLYFICEFFSDLFNEVKCAEKLNKMCCVAWLVARHNLASSHLDPKRVVQAAAAIENWR